MNATIINFGHPISARVLAEIEAWTGRQVQVVDVKVQLDLMSAPLEPQIKAIAQEARRLLGRPERGGLDLILNLPGLSSAAALLIQSFTHVIIGNWGADLCPPPILVLRRSAGVGGEFELAEIVGWPKANPNSRLCVCGSGDPWTTCLGHDGDISYCG